MNEDSNRTQSTVIYVRVASARDEDVQTVARQRDSCERIAATHGLTVLRVYVDAGQPARFAQQQELQQLLADLEAKHDAAFVVVWDYTRLARDMTQLAMVIDRLRVCGAQVATITGVDAVNWPTQYTIKNHR